MDKYMVRSKVNGSVDVVASAANYANALTAWVAENEFDTNEIRDAIDAVFDAQPKEQRLTLPVLVSYTMGHLKPSADQFSNVEDSIRAYVKANPRFHSSKGKNGGVLRLALEGEEIPAPPAKKSA